MSPLKPHSSSKALRIYRSASAKQIRSISSSSASDAAAEMISKYKDKTLLQEQWLDPHQAQKLSLMLNRRELQPGVDVVSQPPRIGTPLPPGYHLVYMTPASLETDLGDDASDRTFNPPGRFTRRMWAGGSLKWKAHNCLRIGDLAEERTRLLSAVSKRSRSGHEMVLVEVEKEFSNAQGVALVDRRSWIFQPDDIQRSRKGAGVDQTPVPTLPYKSVVRDARSSIGLGQRHFMWSPAALFRFSALTYNGHMIHYSDPWCRGVEGLPGPVVHGPLNLINMLDLWRDEHGGDGTSLSSIRYRALAPLYAGSPYSIETGGVEEESGEHDKTCKLSVVSDDGAVTNMVGDVAFA